MTNEPEHVLVVPRSYVGSFYGLNVNHKAISNVLQCPHQRFLPRNTAENDPGYKQIIPYCPILTEDGEVLVYTRGKAGGEDRLHDLLSIGFGGHVNLGDYDPQHAMIRELQEELGLLLPGSDSEIKFTNVGLINEDETDVGKVHVGILYIVLVDKSDVDFEKAEKAISEPRFVHYSKLEEIHGQLEIWSQIAADFILAVKDSHSFSSIFENELDKDMDEEE